MHATADVTTRIEEFVKGAPEEALAILDTVKAEANNTAAFSLYLAKTLHSIAANVAANIKNHSKTGACQHGAVYGSQGPLPWDANSCHARRPRACSGSEAVVPVSRQRIS